MSLFAAIALASVALTAGADDGSRVGVEVAARLAQVDRVRVLVMLVQPQAKADPRRAIAAEVDAVLDRLPKSTLTLRRRFDYVPAFAAELGRDAIESLAADPRVVRVDLDAGGSGQMAEAAPLARIPEVHAAGFDGAGVKIAILDSGIDTQHADFAGRLVGEQCFCSHDADALGCCPDGHATMSGAGSAQDDHGHGTNVAGIAAGGGAVALPGAAPAASLVAVKVLDAGNAFCCSSDIVAALDWVRANHPDTKVLNMSLGTSALFDGDCDGASSFTRAFAAAIESLVANGTMVFACSANQHSATQMAAPACVAKVVAVGAVWDSNLGSQTFLGCTDRPATADLPTCFSNSDAQTDLFAPGAYTTSTGLGGGRSTFGGTSQASPLAAGCAATLAQALPDASPAQIEAALKASPAHVTDPKNGLSFPRLDCADALAKLRASVYAIGADTSGTFYDPAADGQGWIVEAHETTGGSRELLAAWYTYLGGQPRWVIGNGPASGDGAEVPLYIASDGQFPPRFDPQAVRVEPWGHATLHFADRDHASVAWTTSYPGFGDGAMALTRLATPASGASSGAVLGACHSGTWYNPQQSGHGVMVEVLDGQLLAVWYTFLDGAQRWLIGQGPIVGASATLDTISARGADFPPRFNPASVVREPWGTLTFTAVDADRARLSWSSAQPGYDSGTLDLVRLSSLSGRSCD